jgi:hypothetical protein
MKLVVVSTVWKRPALTQRVLSWYRDLKEDVSDEMRVELLAAGSEGRTSRRLVESCGWDYVEAPNEPLSGKWNRVTLAAKDYAADALMVVGSDDLVNKNCLVKAGASMGFASFFGLLDLWFLALDRRPRLGYWPGYDNNRLGEPHGLARTFRSDLLDEMGWCFWPNEPGARNALDRAWHSRVCASSSLGMFVCKMSHIGAYAVDIKEGDSSNICSWSSFKYSQVLTGAEIWESLEKSGVPASTVFGA